MNKLRPPHRRGLQDLEANFFDVNDAQRELLCGWNCSSTSSSCSSSSSASSTRNNSSHMDVDGNSGNNVAIACCGMEFASIHLFEDHVSMTHAHACHICSASFPGNRFLELHLIERHDATHRVHRDRGVKGLFCCLVEDCDVKCDSRRQRQRHLQQIHSFPKGFVFDEDVKMIQRRAEQQQQQQQQRNKNKNNNSKKGAMMVAEGKEELNARRMDVDGLALALEKRVVFQPRGIPATLSFGRKRR